VGAQQTLFHRFILLTNFQIFSVAGSTGRKLEEWRKKVLAFFVEATALSSHNSSTTGGLTITVLLVVAAAARR
jgi:hypothetical protein